MAAILFYKFNGQRTRVTQLHPTVMTLMDKMDRNMLSRFAPDARNLILEYLKLATEVDKWVRKAYELGRLMGPSLRPAHRSPSSCTAISVCNSHQRSCVNEQQNLVANNLVRKLIVDYSMTDTVSASVSPDRSEFFCRQRHILRYANDIATIAHLFLSKYSRIYASTPTHVATTNFVMRFRRVGKDMAKTYNEKTPQGTEHPPQRSRHTSEQVFQQVLNQVPRSEVLEWTDQQDILIRIVGLQPRFQAWETLVQVINGPGCATVQDVKDAVEVIWKNFVRGLYSSLSDFRRDQVVEEPFSHLPGELETGPLMARSLSLIFFDEHLSGSNPSVALFSFKPLMTYDL
ncbi:hypothetical protein BHE90_015008 [Fusarium euwallaceae]|uniref:Uncharacterized protein n=1 Tax=Fusarium euwallaceae TaxID=1147111 RepID=A0A430L4C6_9HYPO|nr:hypothetical protein BHE90_015008 [Fusarium euwallaceae]